MKQNNYQPYPPQPPYTYQNAGSQNSFFDGGLLSLIGHRILAGLLTALTLGIMFPWAICYMQRWETSHTVVDGRRLRFTGTALGLFGNWIKWFLLTLITFGIYGFWVQIKMKKWIVKHTHFAN